MRTSATSVAVRLNLATVTQYLSSQSSLAASLTGGGKRRAVLLRSAPQWDGPAGPVWGDGQTAAVAAAPSPLAVHELIIGHLTDGAAGPDVLVVLTDREQNELDPAILARAHKQRIEAVDSWDVVREVFGAQQVDSRLKEDNWAAEALLDANPPGGWPPIAGGVLSRQTALSALALRRLRLGPYDGDAGPTRPGRGPADGSLDAQALLDWSLTVGGPERFLELRGPERAALAAFLSEEEQAGLAGRGLLALVEAEHGADAVAFGLVCAALWLHAAPDAGVYRARGRAERWFGEQPPATGEHLDALASALGRASEGYVCALLIIAARGTGGATEEGREARRMSETVLDRASALVRQFGAEAAAAESPVLPGGLDARFTAVGQALAAGRLGPLAEAVGSLDVHRRADLPESRVRIERARMGQRLAQWMAGDPAVATDTVAAAIDRQVAETGWVDQALEYIEAGGDPDPVLKSAYDRLGAHVRERRHEIDRNFAHTLAEWTAAGTRPGSMLTVETFLDQVVKPVVRGGNAQRVLLLVLDGMSAAIAVELAEELRASWAEFDPVKEGVPRRRAMAAALPTVTAVSRTSLFAGSLVKGSQADEQRLFPAHKFWGGAPAAVFHKDDLRGEGVGDTFGSSLAEALTDGRTHVAVVLNAIDDRLAKEQKLGDGSWRAGHIPGLLELLRVAATQGMAVLLTSDHGHVVDRHGVRAEAQSPESARHRVPDGTVGKAEVELSGPRVVWPEPGSSITALWDADSRYTALKAGYHGGASLAEFAIPVLAFLPFGATPPKEWKELGDQRPLWWHLDGQQPRPAAVQTDRASAPSAPKKPGRQKPTKTQVELDRTHDSLFDVAPVPAGDGEEALLSTALVSPDESLVAALVASEVFQDQIGLLARKPPQDKVEKALLALLDAGGTLPTTALAQRAGYPATRADGFAAVLRQLLNYDGIQVLETLPDGRTLRLHHGLLRTQFGLSTC
ncbi:BREX-2 system phosphatase PglZ [Streptomyces triculaminicus]|uniref:BREX-2 system phosphatase PglZ n=2 Tax=Streptomyces TaxID=1883 RepID=A0A939FT02_9ACTN|nr:MULTISPECIES: BREX-2 system phosphatase PglZ [Streptomyces]MBO0655480.1 BREX-2 system phosphatase PglZ [Streptomyces triculaminicus]QSY50685.1 BREX-2 system phosphatase PglZ [Streptomyces griseocarneus]